MHFKRIEAYFSRNRYRLLLVFIITFLVLPAFFPDSMLGRLILLFCLSFLLFQSLFVFMDNSVHRKIAFWVVLITLFLNFYTNLFESAHFISRIVQDIILIVFFIFVMFALFRIIKKSKEVTIDVIIVAISNYLILAIVAGTLFHLSYLTEPETAFRIPQDLEPIETTDFVYFAFVTLATVGYGDITPSNKETMTLASLIAVTGQFYVAVLVAFLVSKLVATSDKNK